MKENTQKDLQVSYMCETNFTSRISCDWNLSLLYLPLLY